MGSKATVLTYIDHQGKNRMLCFQFIRKIKIKFQPQETREGDPVPDREGLCVRHTSGHRPVHPGEERAEQTDDRRVSGQPTAVQQGRPHVSPHALRRHD